MRQLRSVIFFVIWGGLVVSSWAHDPGLSSATITVGDRAIDAVAVFNPRDLQSITNDAGADYSALASEILRIRSAGKLLPVRIDRIARDQNKNVTFQISYARAPGATIAVSSGIIDRLPFGHREFVTIHTAAGNSLGDRLLSARENEFSVSIGPVPEAPTASRFTEFLFLGIRHILTGYDHLLFLFGLLVVCRNARSAALLITCFTVAHSLTLGLSTFGLVNLQSRFVEPAIAASIVYVGIENLSRVTMRLDNRWILTLIFGLVHGLGFASVLREMGVANTGANAAIPLVAFNLGVELGQLSVAAIILPIIWKLRERPAFLKIGTPVCSLAIALAGGYWLIERTFFN